jgi:hypothetical protein
MITRPQFKQLLPMLQTDVLVERARRLLADSVRLVIQISGEDFLEVEWYPETLQGRES